MKTTAAIVPTQGAPLELRELQLDDPRPDEVQVRMVASGVCHTDAIVRDQWYPTPLPAVLGHEGAGVVERVGSGVTSVVPGDHVLLSFASCGSCSSCLSGSPSYCTDFYGRNFSGARTDGSTAFTDTDGSPVSSHFFGQSSFARLSNVNESSVVKVPSTAPLELLGPLGCGIMTGSGAVLNVLDPEAGSSFVVFGSGAVGLAGLLAAVVANAAIIIAVDVVDSRLELAASLGATHTINGRNEDVVAGIKEITAGGANYALDTTGNPVVFRQMVDSLGLRGHGALVGAAAPGTEAAIDIGSILLTGLKLSMVIEGDAVPQIFIPKLIALYEAGRFPFDRLVKKYPISEINTAFADSESGATIKPVVVF
ncbi:NAD(P)-dependent alcohol dehydrogenase [Paeniglutamicibacter cryotolerans]|uniref:Aryl-alcohol dehydrogenase n=1 Tax=Paeniglutamicibacter cryotolerans TaxID=670079 RepID=A0A839QCM2_9MICC|nr:NAD(P)-dependent alcohol dehydrogenase [Paeniglutamicibacter cryotolerans]MBB2993868.1 aryl-alcohol dehydrogenase [Paeniglutamicibacter cryotolerans]